MKLPLFEGCTALVTGASSGIGKCFARELAQRGANLIVSARSKDELEKLADELRQQFRVSVHVIASDLAMPDAARQLFAEIQSRKLFVDFLINNAGFGKWAHFLGERLETYDQMLSLNIDTLVQLTYLFIPNMLAQKRGGVINVASTAAFQPLPYIAVYGASKTFVLSLTEALAGEYRNTGVRFLALCPGNTVTNFSTVANADTTGMPSSTPEYVVKSALDAFAKNKNYHVPGLGNFLTAQLPRLLPRCLTIKIVAKMFANRVRGITPT
jgi:short-subunit dehydrogenase